MSIKDTPRVTTANDPEKIIKSKHSIVKGNAILFHNDEKGAWVAPGRVFIYSKVLANAIATKMQAIMERK
jgi:hypothetical protein